MSEPRANPFIADGFILAEEITRYHARTFHFASRFLPREKRRAAYAVYALCRTSDDAVDTGESDTAERASALQRLRAKIAEAYESAHLSDPLLAAFQKTVDDYRIPVIYFEELIKGMETDLAKQRYENFEELYRYCYRAAGVVGLIMLRIFGALKPEAETHAVELGIAMQLTNILRDIAEDFSRGRVYLPIDELRHYGVTFNTIKQGLVNDRMKELLRMQIARARQYYRNASLGLPLIADGRCRFVANVMKDLYAGICDEIEKSGYDVFSRRAHVSLMRKLFLTARILTAGGAS